MARVAQLVVLLLTVELSIQADDSNSSVIACKNERFLLRCNSSQVVVVSHFLVGPDEDCQQRDCYGWPSSFIHEFLECLWKKDACGPFVVDGSFHCLVQPKLPSKPCLLQHCNWIRADGFQCIPGEQVHHICQEEDVELNTTSGYVISPSYPGYYTKHTCRRFINLTRDEALVVASISLDVCDKEGNVDYLRFAMFATEQDALSEPDSCARCGPTTTSSNGVKCGREIGCYTGQETFNFTAYGPGTVLIDFQGLRRGCQRSFLHGFALSFQVVPYAGSNSTEETTIESYTEPLPDSSSTETTENATVGTRLLEKESDKLFRRTLSISVVVAVIVIVIVCSVVVLCYRLRLKRNVEKATNDDTSNVPRVTDLEKPHSNSLLQVGDRHSLEM